MFKWLYKQKDEFVLVKTITLDGVKTATDEGKLYFYLYETKTGKRKVEHKITIKANNNFDRISFYCETVYPWSQGKDFKDIPSYWDTVKERRPDDIKRMYRRFFGA